ncbi:transducin beta-like protein 3 [Watersipora subatra]|uniref:transducin beta-like protein 3 n=1 Tax=Watersipora subatra TaxID=2589382 RepID=UPI00355B63EF
MLHRPAKKVSKDTYEVEFRQEPFYTGGKVKVTTDGDYLLTTCRNSVKVIDMSSGLVVNSIYEEDDPAVTCFCVSPDDQSLVVSSESGLLRLWDWKNQTLIRSWKSIHTGPILEMAIDPTSTLLATGSSDMTIKLWDVDRKYWTHNLKGHTGIITTVTFHPKELWVISASLDLLIKIWNLQTSECMVNLEGHYSAVTGFVIDSLRPNLLVSSGRDKVLMIWNIEEKKRVDTIPVYEVLEDVVELQRESNASLGIRNSEDLHVVTAGSKGALRVWNCKTRSCVHTQTLPESQSKENDSDTDLHSLTQAFVVPSLGVICTTNHEHNIQFFSTQDMKLKKQYIGNNEEIMDVQLFGSNEEFLALATNSTSVRVYGLADFDSDLLHGHTDIVMCISVSNDGCLLLSGSKDNTAILWSVGDGIHDIQKLYTAYGHAQSVSAVCLPRLGCHQFITGSVDNTLKVWRGPSEDLTDSPEQIICTETVLAHDRDINAVDVAPNDKLLVTASRDKTAKVWKADDLSLLGVLKGHSRGIWKAKFSPIDQCIITASADGTLKIFTITDFTCVKTFEGHESPVLNVSFVTRGMQFVSSDDAGIIKLWNIKDTELVKTMEGHSERCWALTTDKSTQDRMVSACAGGTLVVWKDVTEEQVLQVRKQKEKIFLQEQELSNLIHEKRYEEALSLALTMEKPFNTLKIVNEILKMETEEVLSETVEKLSLPQIDVLLRFCTEWNTSSKNCHEAQLLLNQVLRIHSPEDLLQLGNIKTTLEGLIPYTERHYQRMSKLVQQTQFVDYTWQCMRLAEQPAPSDT